jgi:hypothetical protein
METTDILMDYLSISHIEELPRKGIGWRYEDVRSNL